MSYDLISSLKRMASMGEQEIEEIDKVPVVDEIYFEKPSASRKVFDGVQKIWRFKNDYGASVVRHYGSYGGSSGLWELAVIVFNGDSWELTYATSITDDVIGYLSETEVVRYLTEIKALRKLLKEATQK